MESLLTDSIPEISIPDFLTLKVEEKRILLYRKVNRAFYHNLSYDLELVGTYENLEQIVSDIEDVNWRF